MSTSRFITVEIDRQKLKQTITVLPGLIIMMSAVMWVISDLVISNSPHTALETVITDTTAEEVITTEVASYPISGAELNPNLFALRLPPPALDALPYDVREPLSNGTSVPVKRRWVWVPDGQSIIISQNEEGQIHVEVPVGTIWWKEFYIETDRGTFLIERRIITRVNPNSSSPDGWAYYSSHYMPDGINTSEPLLLASTSEQAQQFMFAPDTWLPTQSETMPIEVRFEDARGLQYPYLFPGQSQCTACHNGASGAFPNVSEDPITVFGLHPNNLTSASYAALVERGWISGGDLLLNQTYSDFTVSPAHDGSFDDLTDRVVAVVRNNCASCHNASPNAAANFTAFIIDPNRDYTSTELLDLLSVNGRMMPDAYPLVTPGQLEQSELWLRINGLEDRRRMPPREGGLPEINPNLVNLWRSWIIQSGEQ
jgi:mono/diheme cytochrome c family protein